MPTVSNDGKPFRLRFHRVWDNLVHSISGGLTILHPIKGKWVSPEGQLFSERMIPVRIACTEEQIHQIADLTAKFYIQKAIMFYRVSDCVVIKHYNPQ